jgi:HAE1 family hydrophobic/amphiphilic exporter-1
VEYINILRARGVPRTEAIIQGSVRKLRSILITSLTSILGMLPLVMGVGEGTELYRGVAAVIVGGLMVSTPLTLVALPLLYSLIDESLELSSSISFRIQTMLGAK